VAGGEALVFVVGCVGLALVVRQLARANARDRQRMADALGLTVVRDGRQEAGRDPVRDAGHRWQQLLLDGALLGRAAEVWTRRWRYARGVGDSGGNNQVVLALVLTRESPVRLLVESRTLGGLHGALLGGWDEVATGDAAFDRTFRVTATDAALARAVLSAEVRTVLSAAWSSIAGGLPDTGAGRLSTALLAGTFEVEPHRVSHAVSGTPRPAVSAAFRQTAPVLARLAEAVESTTRASMP
jgi:hypothetical protein